MQGFVIHYNGRVRRCLAGRNNQNRLEVRAITALSETNVPPAEESHCRHRRRGPVYFDFTLDGRVFACSRVVTLKMGRRYPRVEHWFLLPDETHHYMPPEATRSVAPVFT